MTTQNPNSPGQDDLGGALETIKVQLRAIQRELCDFQAQCEMGDLPGDAEATKMLNGVKNWIRLALEMEMKLVQRNANKPADDTTTALDLAAARAEIGCRMARVVECCQAG